MRTASMLASCLTSLVLAFATSRADHPDKPTKVDALNASTMKLGTYGELRLTKKDAGRVVCKEVIDEKSFFASVYFVDKSELKVIMLVPTKGFVDDQKRDELLGKTWLVKDTKKHGGKTYFVLEPYSEPKK